MGLMLKDLGLFIDEARAYGIPDGMAEATLQAWQEAVRRTGADADYSMLIRHLEIDAGVEVRNK
jgi:3-hydroxyisobutyrate dehydrogenase-like beta-hydroxyacid dehydrogenase